jgi:hypothetical protein
VPPVNTGPGEPVGPDASVQFRAPEVLALKVRPEASSALPLEQMPRACGKDPTGPFDAGQPDQQAQAALRDRARGANRRTGRTRSQIMAADHDRVAAGLVVAAVSCTPYAPALLERERLVGRRAQHLGIGERDVFRQRLTLWCRD